MKEYIGEEFLAPYCEALAKGNVEWECRDVRISSVPWAASQHLPDFWEHLVYRVKPPSKRTVTLYDAQGKPHQLIAPERVAPRGNTVVHIPFSMRKETYTYVWVDSRELSNALANGNVFLTREDAQAMADFQRGQRLGEV